LPWLIVAHAPSGAWSALVGILQAAQETHGDPETGMGHELDATVMVALGGPSLAGGRSGIGPTLAAEGPGPRMSCFPPCGTAAVAAVVCGKGLARE
jgi:hypothetical protein